MSQYIDPSASGTQLLPTTRAAFITTVSSAWIITTSMLASFVFSMNGFDSDSPRSAIIGLIMLILTIVFALLGAATGAMLALLCGATLSRQFCWIFTVLIGAMTIPAGFGLFMRTLEALPFAVQRWLMNSPRSTFMLGGMSLPLLMILGIVAGIVMGVILARRRLGFAARSRRAARIIAIWGLCVSLLLEIGWSISRNSLRRFTAEVIPEIILLAVSILVATSFGAVICSERRRITGARFEVLPAQPVG